DVRRRPDLTRAAMRLLTDTKDRFRPGRASPAAEAATIEVPRAVSSVGRAPARQAGGHWFEPSTAHSPEEARFRTGGGVAATEGPGASSAGIRREPPEHGRHWPTTGPQSGNGLPGNDGCLIQGDLSTASKTARAVLSSPPRTARGPRPMSRARSVPHSSLVCSLRAYRFIRPRSDNNASPSRTGPTIPSVIRRASPAPVRALCCTLLTRTEVPMLIEVHGQMTRRA